MLNRFECSSHISMLLLCEYFYVDSHKLNHSNNFRFILANKVEDNTSNCGDEKYFLKKIFRKKIKTLKVVTFHRNWRIKCWKSVKNSCENQLKLLRIHWSYCVRRNISQNLTLKYFFTTLEESSEERRTTTKIILWNVKVIKSMKVVFMWWRNYKLQI